MDVALDKEVDKRISKFVDACKAARCGKYDHKSHFSLVRDVAAAVRTRVAKRCKLWVPMTMPWDTAAVLHFEENSQEAKLVHMQLSEEYLTWGEQAVAFTVQIYEEYKDENSGDMLTNRHGRSISQARMRYSIKNNNENSFI